MTHEIDLRHFPGPGHYASDFVPKNQLRQLPISIFALHLQLVTQPGNILQSEQSKGFYFFRDAQIPLPRAATILAWQRICILGIPASTEYYLPFLPALREDDEVGSAIGERGSRIASLSRKSKYHLRDSEDRIIWGPVYIADRVYNRLIGQTERSDFCESLVTSRSNQSRVASQESIRERMSFLAQHGFPATNALMKHLGIPRIYRLLFQFLSRDAAEEWQKAYNSAFMLINTDPDSVDADFKQMCHELEVARLNRKAESDDEGSDENDESGQGNKFLKKGRFGTLDGIDF
jgi:hypothetical protein